MYRCIVPIAIIASAVVSAIGQGTAVKPPESTSKVKKVLLYNKIGGWRHDAGIRQLTDLMNQMSKAKGFALTVLEDDAALTPAFLRDFNAIIWNNNVNGFGSVPSATARTAVLDYVKAGGGWVLVHGAGDHHDTWVELKSVVLGTRFTVHGAQGIAETSLDDEAKAHPELKWMVRDLPQMSRFWDEWYSFQNTVRKLPGITVVMKAGNPAGTGILNPMGDGSNDHTYVWARKIEKGRTLYTALGHGVSQGGGTYAQADSFATKSIWENIRYVAGDYQNGCMDRNSSKFDPAARVSDPAACAGGTVAVAERRSSSGLALLHQGKKMEIAFPHGGKVAVELRSLDGKLAWSAITDGVEAISLDSSLPRGLYLLRMENGRNSLRARILLP